jgi:transposase
LLGASRRKFHELAAVAKALIAAEAVRRIDELFAIERRINGRSADKRRAARLIAAAQ